MKVGIITQPVGNNYGGILQNWALQQVLINLGHSPITIDAYRAYPYYRWLFTAVRFSMMRLLGFKNTEYPIRPINGRIIDPTTAPFIFNHLAITKPYEKLSSEIIDKEGLDAIVVGSDQVWRPKYNYHLEEMFLRFAYDRAIKRVAYAISFGSSVWEFTEEQTKNCSQFVQKFDNVSVREDSAVELCNNYLKVQVEQVLDPTLLIENEEYLNLCKDEKRHNEKYALFYCLDQTGEKIEFAKKMSHAMNLKIHEFSPKSSKRISVNEWLSLFRDSSCVITDSFHGTVFSILFQKDFWTINNDKRGSSRFNSLLKSLNLTNRIMMDDKLIVQDGSQIDWCDVMTRLQKMKKHSKDYLEDSLRV